LLSSAVEEYNPTNDIDDLVWLSKNDGAVDAKSDKIVDFPSHVA
jgi:hypothetical protein